VIYRETSVQGVFLLELEKLADERGYFARTWSAEEFTARGLDPNIHQCSVSFNARRGTLRGMHYQTAPFEETKLVRCIRGSVFDVALDLRPESPTYLRHAAVVLDSESGNMLYIPKGCAHGFETLEDGSEVAYQISAAYAPEYARGVRWDDPAFGIAWPLPPAVINERDRNYSDYRVHRAPPAEVLP